MPDGTYFLPFAKPGKVKEGMTKWEKDFQAQKTEKAKRWIHACGRKDFNSVTQITKNTFICSLHFHEPIDDNPDPIIATSSIERIASKRKGRKQKILEQPDEDVSVDPVPDDAPFVTAEKTPSPSYFSDKSTQTVNVQKAVLAARIENKILRNKILLGGKKRPVKKLNPMRYKSIYSDRKKCKHFTGLFPEQFDSLFKFLGPAKYCLTYWGSKKKGKSSKPTKIKTFSIREQLFLTLLRLRRGFTLLTLSYFFFTSEYTVRRIFTTWIMYLYHHFKDYSSFMFPDRHAFARVKPAVFRHFKNIRCIVDCTEFLCEVPRDYGRQGNFYSSYKHHCTMKCLIAVTPSGGACFISDLYEGSADDVKMFEECGILAHINPGDTVMVDKGFTVQELLLAKQATIFIPPFLGKRDKFTKEEVILLKRIAKARIHVERFNERLKKFRLLDQVIPLNLAPIASQMVYVACCLVNFQDTLCK